MTQMTLTVALFLLSIKTNRSTLPLVDVVLPDPRQTRIDLLTKSTYQNLRINGLDLMKVLQHMHISIFRILLFPDQCSQFNCRHPDQPWLCLALFITMVTGADIL